MTSKFLLWLSALTLISSPAAAWDIPADNGTMGKAAIDEILAGNDYPETSTYKQAIDFIDFLLPTHCADALPICGTRKVSVSYNEVSIDNC